MKKVATRKKIIALLISYALLISMVMPSLAFAGTCPITNCRAANSEQFQETGLYSTSTHVVNKILFIFGGETCTIRDYYKYYAKVKGEDIRLPCPLHLFYKRKVGICQNIFFIS